MSAFQPVDLVESDHDGHTELEDASRHELVACPDSFPGGEDEEDGFDVLEGSVHGALHVFRQRVERTLEPRQVGEDELIVVPVRDPEDPAARRLRLVGHDRDLPAGEGVHDRGLADVRPPGHRDEAGLQVGRSQVSGSRSAAE